MKKDRKWTATAAGKMTLVFVSTAFVVMLINIGSAMIIRNVALEIVLIVAGLALFGVISTVFGKYITQQISMVEKRLEDISAGDVHTFTEKHEEKTEFDELYNTLEDTVIHLNDVITEINKGLDELAAGNLNYKLPSSWNGDFELISRKYNDITSSLRQTFRNIDNASNQVSNGSQQVADGAQTLSQGATEQAASIDQLTSQINTISDRVHNTAVSAGKAMQVVNDTSDKIRECGKEMDQMLSAMDEINNSSSEISKIIKVIDDIAFQTNILALNAAVEAARAGSAGKGFAVVADEVRNLAAKSAEAAKQTTSLIENSIESVKKGAEIAQETAGTLDQIIVNSDLIVTEVATISDASNEQAGEIKRVSVGVEQIAAVVQSNTATAEESAATSEELSGQSGILRNLLAHFKINDGDSVEGFTNDEAPYSFDDSGDNSFNDIPAEDNTDYSSSSDYSDYSDNTDYSNVFDYYVNGNDSEAFEEPASHDDHEDFVPVDFSDMDDEPVKQKPTHIYLDDDFVNVQSKY